jgi:tRNA-uridine 2-sulfurtransferase
MSGSITPSTSSMPHVYVGMSGGVDSSVTAALLQQQGYRVTGVYMKNWTEDLPGMKCPWADDLADAKRVAVQLGIDFKVFDFQEEYRQKVVDYMIAEYQAGRTPNPDVMCNQEIKFKLFLDTALKDGADMIATGHYARVVKGESSASLSDPTPSPSAPGPVPKAPPIFSSQEDKYGVPSFGPPVTNTEGYSTKEETSGIELSTTSLQHTAIGPPTPKSPLERSEAVTEEVGGRVGSGGDVGGEAVTTTASLYMGLDKNKDQSYFLYRVTEDALRKTLFPVGELTKPEVRAKAEEFGLITASKKDSQGICFVGEVGIKDFLQQYVTAEPGDIIDKTTGKVIGEHEGAIFYTFGQRHGLKVGGGLPYYVVAKDMAKNIVYVTTNLNDENLWRSELTLQQLHWINEVPEPEKTYQVRTRYRAALIDVTLRFKANQLHLSLKDPERAITPGQSAVIYDGDRVVGGGIVA